MLRDRIIAVHYTFFGEKATDVDIFECIQIIIRCLLLLLMVNVKLFGVVVLR